MNKILKLALADNDIVIIPGHGPVGDKADLIVYRDMLVKARDRIMPLIADGKSVEEIVAAKPLADLDGEWGSGVPEPQALPAGDARGAEAVGF